MQWILKMTGALLVFAAGALWGLAKGQTYVRRAKMLAEMTAFLRHLETNLRFRRDATSDLLREAWHACRLRWLPLALPALQDTAQLPQLLQTALETMAQQTQGVLTDADRSVFSEALLQLGQGQTQEESQKLSYAITVLEQASRAAAQEAAVQNKLYRTLGLSGGAAAAVLLL